MQIDSVLTVPARPPHLQALLLLLGVRSSAHLPQHACADLALLPVKAADGFILQPATLQAAASDCGVVPSQAHALVAASAICLPMTATSVGAVAWSASGTDAALVAAGGGGAALHGMQRRPVHELEPSLAAAHILDVTETVYSVEWLVADSLPAAALVAPAQPALVAAAVGSGRGQRLAPLTLSQAASVAAADVVQVLHSHVRAPLKTLALHAVDSQPAQAQLVPAQPAVAAAAVAGVLKNLPFELPSLSSQLVDVEASAGSAGGRAFALSATALSAGLQADLYGVAARGGALHPPLLAYSEPEQAAPEAELTNDGTWAITGGLGGLGLLAASWLARGGTQALVLLSRSGVAASAADGAAITASPALVAIAKCDVSRGEDARLLAAVARRQARAFRGILHTAGLQVEARLPAQTLRTMRQAIAPKLGAVQNCLEAAPADPLALSLLFSSVSSISGNAGHANYAAANAVLDAVAAQQALGGARTVAVQWGAWASVGELVAGASRAVSGW